MSTCYDFYTTDIFVCVPENMDLQEKLSELNSVHRSIQLTLEVENDGRLPFLDVMVMNGGRQASFSVYRKLTNKDDFIHYYSAHEDRVKTGVVLGFFLRAMRICSAEFLEGELRYVIDSFVKLMYPLGLLLRLKRKALQIARRQGGKAAADKHKYVLVPSSEGTKSIRDTMGRGRSQIVTSSGIKIKDLVRTGRRGTLGPKENSAIYRIPCSQCELAYFGETGRGFSTRLKEHKSDLRFSRMSNAMVLHELKTGHVPWWTGASVLIEGLTQRKRKLYESVLIGKMNCSNVSAGSFKLAEVPAWLIFELEIRKRIK